MPINALLEITLYLSLEYLQQFSSTLLGND